MADHPESEEQEFPLEPPKQDWPRARGKECILIAEDSEPLRDLVLAMLSGLGYEVLTAAGGHEALRQVERHHGVDLVITDAIMPKGGGFQIMDEMRERWPGTPILFTSGFTEEIEAGLRERLGDRAPGQAAAADEDAEEGVAGDDPEASETADEEDEAPAPVVEFLAKPFKPEKLAHLVREILDRVKSGAPPRRGA
jgi:CheY-like chemotaxis protein